MLKYLNRPINYDVSPDGVLIFYDDVRGKFLSADRPKFEFGIKHRNAKPIRFLYTTYGTVSKVNGTNLPRNAVITAVTFKSTSSGTGKFSVTTLNSGIHTVEYELNLASQSEKVVDNLDISVNVGNSFCVRLDEGTWDFPSVLVECAYRY